MAGSTRGARTDSEIRFSHLAGSIAHLLEAAEARFSDLEEQLIHVQDAVRSDRDVSRRAMDDTLEAFAGSIGQRAERALAQAVQDSEGRMARQIELAVEQLRGGLMEAEETSRRYITQATEAEEARVQELQQSLADLREALHGTHTLAAAQREEADLLDGALQTLQQSLVDLRSSVAAQHLELREDLIRHRRSSSALLKRQLRPIIESLPALVAEAAERREEETVRRIEKALARLRRSLEENVPGGSGRRK